MGIPQLAAGTFCVRGRALSIASDDLFVEHFLRRTYRRVSAGTSQPIEQPLDRGEILLNGGSARLVFNGEEIAWPPEASDERTPFIGAFYGSREFFRLVAARLKSCWAFYGAALQLGSGAIAIVGRSGIGKTTLVLELLARGARLYSDECVFIDKVNGSADGLPRALMIRESALEFLSSIPGVDAACRRAPFHTTPRGRLWYAIEPREIFDRDFAVRPSPLTAFVVLEDERSTSATVSRISATLAAAELARRCHAKPSAVDDLAEIARRFRAIACYRLRLGSPRTTADLVYETCRSA